VPDEWLQADIKQGISSHEVESRRKRFGWNEITTEKENLFIKFLMFFTGPILYGMSSPSSFPHPSARFRVYVACVGYRWSPCFAFSPAKLATPAIVGATGAGKPGPPLAH